MTIESTNKNPILWDFLIDAKNIKEYKCNYESLEKPYVEAQNILLTKSFDINFKDHLGIDTHPSLKGEDSSCEMRVPTHENIFGGIYISLMYCTASATPFSYS